MRLITYQRPGYQGSDRDPGRSIGDAARDLEAILDRLGIETFVTLGWSGGGPHALACAALLPDRCASVATIGSLSPHDAADTSWWQHMSEPNERVFRAALAGESELRAELAATRERFVDVTGADLTRALRGLVSPPDEAALTPGLADVLARARRQAASSGFDGWVDDLLALARPWDTDLQSITAPTTIWHGAQDHFVAAHHAERMTSSIEGAELRVEPEHGHLSIVTDCLEAILDTLAPGRSS